MMTWDELNKDFNKRRPVGEPIGSTFWFKKVWSDSRKSVNDLLREFLAQFKYQYIQTYNGDIWILYRGNWTKCKWICEAGEVSFYLLEYIWN
jgi:hypothetical protein